MPRKEITYYSFRVIETGELVRIEDGDRLSGREELPVYKAESPDALALVLFSNTPYYNADYETPNWGGFRPEELQPVKVTVVQDVEDVALPELINLKSIETRDIPYAVACQYVKTKFVRRPQDKYLVFWLVELPEGQTLQELHERVAEKFAYAGDRWNKRYVYAVLPVPEEYVDVCEKPAALLIASGSCFD